MSIGYANRGAAFEELVTLANRQYRQRGLAVVHKVPTAWVPLRDGSGRVVNAKVEEKAAVDFLGVYGGRGLAFDVKECGEKRWPLRQLEPHQADYLRDTAATGGIAFILISFWRAGGLVYLVPWGELEGRIAQWQAGGSASIRLEELRFSRPPVPHTGRAMLDYLVEVDRVWAS